MQTLSSVFAFIGCEELCDKKECDICFFSLWNFKGVNVNCVDANGGTPLHLASLNGHRYV